MDNSGDKRGDGKRLESLWQRNKRGNVWASVDDQILERIFERLFLKKEKTRRSKTQKRHVRAFLFEDYEVVSRSAKESFEERGDNERENGDDSVLSACWTNTMWQQLRQTKSDMSSQQRKTSFEL